MIHADSFVRYFFPSDSKRFLVRTVPVCIAALATFVAGAAYYGKLIEPGSLGFFASINFRFPLITLLFASAVNYYLGRHRRSLDKFLANAAHGSDAERQRLVAQLRAIGRGETPTGAWLRSFRWAVYAAATAAWFYLYVYRPLFTDFVVGDWENPDHPLAFLGFAGWYFVLWVPILAAALNAMVTGLYATVRAAAEVEGQKGSERPSDAQSSMRAVRSLGDALLISDLVLLVPLLYLIPSVALYRSDSALRAIAAYSLMVGALVLASVWRVHRSMQRLHQQVARSLEPDEGANAGETVAAADAAMRTSGPGSARPAGNVPTWPMGTAHLGALLASFLVPALAAIYLLLAL